MNEEYSYYTDNAVECNNELNKALLSLSQARSDILAAIKELDDEEVDCALSRKGKEFLMNADKAINNIDALIQEGKKELYTNAQKLDKEYSLKEKIRENKDIQDNTTIQNQDELQVTDNVDDNTIDIGLLSSAVVGVGTGLSIKEGIKKTKDEDEYTENNDTVENK